MTEEIRLKRCPFCGGEVQLEETVKKGSFGVVCRSTKNLGGTCAIESIPSGKKAAIKRWNTRASDPVKAQLVEALKAAKEAIEILIEEKIANMDEEHATQAMMQIFELTKSTGKKVHELVAERFKKIEAALAAAEEEV